MKIVIVGASGQGRVALDVARAEGAHEVVGVLDRDREVGSVWLGCPVLGRDDAMAEIVSKKGIEGYFVGIGDNSGRAAVARRISESAASLPLATLVHPAATIAADARVGPGALVAAGAVIGAGAEIGALTIVNTRASLDHESILEDAASLAPGVVTGGNVRIGRGAAIGIGATLVHGIEIGPHTVVGAGAVVTQNLPERVVAYGTPARVIRQRAEDEPYL